MHQPLRIIVIGLGHQSLEDHLPAICDSKKFNLVGVVDIDANLASKIGKEYGVISDNNTVSLINNLPEKPDVALIAVPHNGYMSILSELAKQKIHIIKEKPFATSISEAEQIKRLAKENNISIFVTLQRRFNPIFQGFEQLVKRIGKIYSIEARYTFNIAKLDEGWRAKKSHAIGGALIDMGYHFIDLLIWYFGLPDSVMCKLSTGNRENQKYDVEDTALLDFAYNDLLGDDERTLGSMIVSRVYPAKEEVLIAYGSKGSVSVRRGDLLRLDVDGNEIEHLSRIGGWPTAIVDQLEDFADKITNGTENGKIRNEYLRQVALLEAAYKSCQTRASENPLDYLKLLTREHKWKNPN